MTTSVEDLGKALIVTAEVMGHELSATAAKAMALDLADYPEHLVSTALQRVRREHTGRLTLAAIIQRIDDGHLGSEEAWALCPDGEGDTVVWTDEIATAYDACKRLLDGGDAVAARMAFRECYSRRVQESRAARRQARWWVSLGHDSAGRFDALRQAVSLGRITSDEAAKHGLLPQAAAPALPSPKRNEPAMPARELADDVARVIASLRKGE